MFMGKIPLFINSMSDNSFSAQGMVGSCSEKNMTWRVWFSITKNQREEKFFIDFTSYLR